MYYLQHATNELFFIPAWLKKKKKAFKKSGNVFNTVASGFKWPAGFFQS